MSSRNLFTTVFLFAMVFSSQSVSGREPSLTVGDFITTLYQTSVMDREKILTTLEAGIELTALDVQDGWILVNVPRAGEAVEGWINGQHVSLRPDCEQSTITFDNQSGESVLVRIVGPTRTEVQVADGQTRTLENVAAGHYRLRARYTGQRGPRFVEGDHFDVKASANTFSRITITLHGVINGNYGTRPISEEEFNGSAQNGRAARQAEAR